MKIPFNSTNMMTRLALGIVVAFTVSIVAFYVALNPRIADLKLMGLFLSATSLVTLLVGQIAYRLGWLSQAPSLRWALFGTYLLAALMTFFSVWLTAKLMFVSDHDLLLGTVLLLFASGITMTLGYFFSETLARRITSLSNTTRDIRLGGLGARVRVEGQDEIAQLSKSFNSMLDRLERAEQRQAELEALRRDLISWVSHDLQTPLASIQAIVEALADGIVEDAQTQQRYLRTAQRDIKALSHLIDDLFEMAQIDAGGVTLDIRPNSLADIISDTIESFSALAASRQITLSGSIAPRLDSVEMDAPRIGRVLSNLINNALRHTPPGGKVTLTAAPDKDRVAIIVQDTGEGFSPEDLPYLFERFYRGEKSRNRVTGGSGLGLAIAQGFVEAHNGRIKAELVPEGGARFCISLPAVHKNVPSPKTTV